MQSRGSALNDDRAAARYGHHSLSVAGRK
jgi:hypothetical protein